ncbi:SDR family NAD(P)-dependent oxidoreductase [Streptomyces sp. DSM 116496]|uniref:SDR family NAD(P)-dependent oxidoreductase n=1 Tax=Streptomyces stoeckheimensis TaxID=3344656 RepID=UPI0038B309BF
MGPVLQEPGVRLVPLALDLPGLESVAASSGAVLAEGRPLDLLVNNAGIMAIPERRTTKDGFELTVATNHLGHFALTGHLVPALGASTAPRVVTVSAMVARSRSARPPERPAERAAPPPDGRLRQDRRSL